VHTRKRKTNCSNVRAPRGEESQEKGEVHSVVPSGGVIYMRKKEERTITAFKTEKGTEKTEVDSTLPEKEGPGQPFYLAGKEKTGQMTYDGGSG